MVVLHVQTVGQKNSENNPTVNEQAKLFSDFNDEMSVEIWHVMGQLTESERDVVILKWFCGYTLKEAANIMDKPYDTVIKMHNRLKGKLKKFCRQTSFSENFCKKYQHRLRNASGVFAVKTPLPCTCATSKGNVLLQDLFQKGVPPEA